MSKLTFPTSSAALLEPYLPASSSLSSSSPSETTTTTTAASPHQPHRKDRESFPHLTLTYAQSLEGALALAPGLQTHLSGPETKALTHFLRSRHDAILVGVGTAVVDDPGLNCRVEVSMATATIASTTTDSSTATDMSMSTDSSMAASSFMAASTAASTASRLASDPLAYQPRPVVLDTYARWAVGRESKCIRLAREGQGKGPWVVCSAEVKGREDVVERGEVVREVGGEYIFLEDDDDDNEQDGSGYGRLEQSKGEEEGKEKAISKRLDWRKLLAALKQKGIDSLMVEGGGQIINGLLSEENKALVDSVIVTIAPVWLGQGGVDVSPPAVVDERGKKVAAVRLGDVKWYPFGQDIVLCGRVL